MARTKLVNGVVTPFTPAEEAHRDAEEAADAAAAPAVAAEKVRKAAIDQATTDDGRLAAWAAMTVQQQDAWWAANVTSFATASPILKALVRLAARKLIG